MENQTFKVVVTGPFASGKTTFISTASNGAVIGSENDVSDATQALKQSTTTAMDHASVLIDGTGSKVGLFGTPGQERFSFMWPVLSQGMDAYLILIDASRLQARAQARSIVRAFESFAPDVPFLVAVNRWEEGDLAASDLAEFIGVSPHVIVECDPRQRHDCHRTVAHVLELVTAGAAS